ncbi:MAG TPA: cytochrome b/b6 domain-containing protein [Pseudolabrys sp.]|nr:cytochrome b/b6 domain-containing protein [Pseudolabrys sp.]
MRDTVIWDAPTRLFHWAAAALVLAAYVTWRLNWMHWHIFAGDALLALVLFRLAWGFAGSETARFSNFLVSPMAAARYLAKTLRRKPDDQRDATPGHNPAGGWMILLLLMLLLVEALTGIFVSNDVADVGPLTAQAPAWVDNLITDLHALLWQVLLGAIALHVLAVAAYWAIKRQNLVRPMVNGRKALPADMPPPAMASPLRAALLFTGGAAVAAALSIFL